MLVCIRVPRFELIVAAGGAERIVGRPLAIAPDVPAGAIGEVSGTAEALGVASGMSLAEALARAPALELIPGDPIAVVAAWERGLVALESIGAEVEANCAGVAYFDAGPLRRLHGGTHDLVLAAAARSLAGTARIGAASTRLAALAASYRARPRRPALVRQPARAFLAPLPVELLRDHLPASSVVDRLEQLGVATLGALAAMPRAAMADRFGAPGSAAHRLACGEDDALIPRAPIAPVAEAIELPESASGPQLEQALGVLVARLLARAERRGRALRGVTIAARLTSGGSWRAPVVFREAVADAERMRLALSAPLALLPAPADTLELASAEFRPGAPGQQPLLPHPGEVRRARLNDAIQGARSAAGPNAVMRVLTLEDVSRVPERQVVFAPFDAS
jgi:protein ImuB